MLSAKLNHSGFRTERNIMKYFITWSYEGTEIYSHVYNFKYYINDADDFNYLKMEIASNHTIKGTEENPNVNNIHIIINVSII